MTILMLLVLKRTGNGEDGEEIAGERLHDETTVRSLCAAVK